MSEEVTYATLTFQDSVAARNNRDRNNLRKRGRSSEKARCNLGGWTGVRCLEVLALILMLKTGVLINQRTSYHNISYMDSVILKKKGYPAPSPIWRQAALGLLTLCLMLLIGLTSNEINSDSEKLSQLQKIIHQQQDNLSQQLSNYRNFPMEEEFLKSQISSLLKRQRQMAIKLCQELIIHTSGNQDLLTSQIKSVALAKADYVHHLGI
ncbi:hypothetical protein J1605_021041 [Eschrichtius robustus]|uniref:Coiled-coil domain-containing protein n=1 Tax=Eschrichtius robustus TaxID=9764 RepID=A0AB34HHP3_ESCRO|nr:hypothetical protein J1605_021041 [Eschrichtius robustus]